MIEDKVFSHRPIEELLAIVKNDFRKFDSEGLIDDGTLIKTVMYCNEKLGLPIKQVREIAIDVNDYRAELPLDFEKLYYVSALKCSNTSVQMGRNPFDNSVDQTVIYDACLDRSQLGCVDNYNVTINRKGVDMNFHYNEWTQLQVTGSDRMCHIDCPNKNTLGRYQVQIKDDYIQTPFKTGMLYVMYIGLMRDEEGNITFPFHPLITPYYEWSIKEKVISDAIFNSDSANLGELYKIAQQNRVKSWLDAYNFSTTDDYGKYKENQRKRELGWYNKYFKPFM